MANDEPPLELVIQEAPKDRSMPSEEMEDSELEKDMIIRDTSDKDLLEKIDRAKRYLKNNDNLKDGGVKLRAMLRKQEAELQRRTRMKADNQHMKVTLVVDEPTGNGATDDVSPRRAPTSAPTSEFALRFESKLDDPKAKKCFGEELSTLNRGNHQNMRGNLPLSSRKPHTRSFSSREASFKSPRHLSVDIKKASQSNNEQRGSHSSYLLPHESDKKESSSAKKENATRCQSLFKSRRNKRKNLVLVDEELEDNVVNIEDQVYQRSKEIRLFYPSRDDPEAIDICYSDMQCLAPATYLSSPIMNFYIRHLQKLKTATARRKCNYHFFNTFFYKKLKQAVLAKADKETTFLKFRRWWKGVNIFEQAYIFLPIHENNHWSLVIICMPNKEDKSGPIILHLDSLGLHSSKSIFSNVKSFLIEEWNILKQEVFPADIAENIWDNLSRRIVEKVVEVPQQPNEYDCGVFVLYFMECFLEHANERLSKDDLETFGRKWFKSEEASSFRRKIRKLLKQEFEKASESTG